MFSELLHDLSPFAPLSRQYNSKKFNYLSMILACLLYVHADFIYLFIFIVFLGIIIIY